MYIKNIFGIEKQKLEKKIFSPGKKSKIKNLFPTIFLMKVMKKSPVMKLKSFNT